MKGEMEVVDNNNKCKKLSILVVWLHSDVLFIQ